MDHDAQDTSPALPAAPETTSAATQTGTPSASDASIMNTDMATTCLDLANEMARLGREISRAAGTIRFSAAALAQYLDDDSIVRAAEDMIIRAASTKGSDAISLLTGTVPVA